MQRKAIQYVNPVRDWTHNVVSVPISPSPLLQSSVFLLDVFSLLLSLPCTSLHLSYQLPHYGQGAAEGDRIRGKLLRDHTRMGPKLESGVSCQQHSDCQSRGSKNKQWKSKPQVLFLQIRFLGKKKCGNFKIP